MPGMKRDCGGAAGILGGFRAAVKQVLYACKTGFYHLIMTSYFCSRVSRKTCMPYSVLLRMLLVQRLQDLMIFIRFTLESK